MLCSGREADSSGLSLTRFGDTVAVFVSDLLEVLEFENNSSGNDFIELRLVLEAGLPSVTRLSGLNALKSAREYSEENRPRAIKDVSAVDHRLRSPLLAKNCLCIVIEFLLGILFLVDSFALRDLPLSDVSSVVLFFADERNECVD